MLVAGLLSIIAIETGISAETMIELVSKSGFAISKCIKDANFNDFLTKLIHSDHVFNTADGLEGIARGLEKDNCADDTDSFSHSTDNTISGVSRVLAFILKLIPRAADISLFKSIFVASSEFGVISEALKKLTNKELKKLNSLVAGEGPEDGAGEAEDGAGGVEGGVGVMAAPAGSLASGDQSTRALAGNAVISKLSDEIFKVLNMAADEVDDLKEPLIAGNENGRDTSQIKDNAVQRHEVIAGEIASILQSSICSAVITNISALQPLIQTELSARQSAKDSGKGSQAQENLVASPLSEQISRALNGLELASRQQASAHDKRHESVEAGEGGTLPETIDAVAGSIGAVTQSFAATGVVSVEGLDILVSRCFTLIDTEASEKELGEVSGKISRIINEEFKKAFDENSKKREGEAGTSNSLNNGVTNATLAMRITLSKFGQSLLQACPKVGKSADGEPESKLDDGELHTAQRAMLNSLGRMLIELSKSGSFCSAFSGAVLSSPMTLPVLQDSLEKSSNNNAGETREGIVKSSRSGGSAAGCTAESSRGEEDDCDSSTKATRGTAIPIDGVTSAVDTILRNIILSIFNMARTGTLTASGVSHLLSTIVSAPNPSGETRRDIDITQGLAPEESLLKASSRSKEERKMELSIISAALTAGLVQPSDELIRHINNSIEFLTGQFNDVLGLLLSGQSKSLQIPAETINLDSSVNCLLESTLQRLMRGVNLLRDSDDGEPSDDTIESKVKVRDYIKILIGIMNPDLCGKDVILDNLASIYNKGGRKIGTISHKGEYGEETVTLDRFTKGILEAIPVGDGEDVPMAEPVKMEDWVKSYNKVELAEPVAEGFEAAVDATDDINITKCLNESQTAADLRDNFINKVYEEFVAGGTSDSLDALGELIGKGLSNDASSLHGYILREVRDKIAFELSKTQVMQPLTQVKQRLCGPQVQDNTPCKRLERAKQTLDNLITGETGLSDEGLEGGAGAVRSPSPSAPTLVFKSNTSGGSGGLHDFDDV